MSADPGGCSVACPAGPIRALLERFSPILLLDDGSSAQPPPPGASGAAPPPSYLPPVYGGTYGGGAMPAGDGSDSGGGGGTDGGNDGWGAPERRLAAEGGGGGGSAGALTALVASVVDLSFSLRAARTDTSADAALLSAEELAAFLRDAHYVWRGAASTWLPTTATAANGGSSSPPTNDSAASPTAAANDAAATAAAVSDVLLNVYQSTGLGDGEPLPLLALATVFSGASRAVLCPRPGPPDPATGLPAFPRISAPGCPCSWGGGGGGGGAGEADGAAPAPPASHSRCPAGYICSREAFRALPTDDAAWLQLRAVCVPCLAGQYCAEGTTTAGGNSDWVQRLRDGRGPIRGNYCPQNSTTPGVKCPGGSYCPNASVVLPCPAGHYCKPQSVHPVECPPLAVCPPGTTYARGDHIAGLLFGLILAGTCVSLLAAKLGVWLLEVVTRYHAALETVKRDIEQAQQGRASGECYVGVTCMRLDVVFNNVTARLHRSSADKGKGSGKAGRGAAKGLMGVSGQLYAENVNAVMGPSGCGKSTLIKVLSGRILPAEGVTVSFGSQEGVVLSSTKFRRLLGYVPQEDVLHANLTVRENLEYSARLTMRPDVQPLVRHALVYAFLKELNLAHRQDYIVGSEQKPETSGGERKRVNIGMGMVSLPPILILDEPTSGLDASTSFAVVQLMHDLSRHAGMNVVTVLHQPRYDSFFMFDNVIVLANNGMVVYQGGPMGCGSYFKGLGFRVGENTNIADFILDITTGDNAEMCRSSLDIRWDDLPFLWLLQSYVEDRKRFQKMQSELHRCHGFACMHDLAT
ncbi:hypothetical protein GPECTOR_16g590 [Gonium pectorale]|uniref:ABC transporter domain-containing protein n=1 Tax=Gonium pectorale TaxID=33097 RepID=A0A150GKN5_GONPE|nr:hypothetical protein GPECTOR_16g590 [Gonium pectorale]|eukprot:KXZ50416.1 hypothetical protein GPECTOR_16g590 [Gonium pectorale]